MPAEPLLAVRFLEPDQSPDRDASTGSGIADVTRAVLRRSPGSSLTRRLVDANLVQYMVYTNLQHPDRGFPARLRSVGASAMLTADLVTNVAVAV